jgi:hypothetical protein
MYAVAEILELVKLKEQQQAINELYENEEKITIDFEGKRRCHHLLILIKK